MQPEPLKIVIPLKVRSSTAKQVVGPYVRVTRHYYLALGFNAPDPLSVRWELHIVADPGGILGGWERGVASLLGYKSLVKYEGDWRSLKQKFAVSGAKGTLHVVPWGIPLIVLADVGPVDEKLRALMDLHGLSSARRFLEELARETIILEA